MKIVVNVLRCDQSFFPDTGSTQNYLVLNVLGVETRIAVSDDQMQEAIKQSIELNSTDETATRSGPEEGTEDEEPAPSPRVFSFAAATAEPADPEPEPAEDVQEPGFTFTMPTPVTQRPVARAPRPAAPAPKKITTPRKEVDEDGFSQG